MTEVEGFLAAAMPRLTEAEIAIHNGDAVPRDTTWSHGEPLTLFGAAKSARGWADIRPIFEWLANRFSDCTSYEIEIIAAGASGDLAYTVAFEHTTASMEGAPAPPYVLRVTTIFRREDGDWKIAHRHADTLADSDVGARSLSKVLR